MRARLPLAALLFAFSASAAQAAQMSELSAVERQGRVDVRFRLDGGFQPDIVRAVRSGVPTGITYQVQLIRKRPNWFDTHVADARIEAVVSFNSITGEYLLNYRRNRRLVRSEVLSSFEELERRMTRISEPELFSLAGYPANKLRVRVRAELIRDWVLYVMPRPVRTDWLQTRVVPERP